MKYNVIFKEYFTNVESIIDTIEGDYDYTIIDYFDDCKSNAPDEWSAELEMLKNKGDLHLELIEFNMLEIKSFPDELLKANGITQEYINIINETDLQSAESTTFTSLEDVRVCFDEWYYDEWYYDMLF